MILIFYIFDVTEIMLTIIITVTFELSFVESVTKQTTAIISTTYRRFVCFAAVTTTPAAA